VRHTLNTQGRLVGTVQLTHEGHWTGVEMLTCAASSAWVNQVMACSANDRPGTARGGPVYNQGRLAANRVKHAGGLTRRRLKAWPGYHQPPSVTSPDGSGTAGLRRRYWTADVRRASGLMLCAALASLPDVRRGRVTTLLWRSSRQA
jgi:hypothetical protein